MFLQASWKELRGNGLSRILEFSVPKEFDGKKLSAFIRGYAGLSYSLYATLRHTEGSVQRDGKLIRSIDRVFEGDVITVTLPDRETEIIPTPMELDIIYEDDDLLVLNKSGFTAVHPSHGHREDTLANGVVHYLLSKGRSAAFRAVGRLDKGTSGVVVCALNTYSASKLSGNVEKTYIAKLDKPFDKALMNMPWQDFLAQLMEEGAAGFVCGEDFRFGYRGQGNARLLADFCRERELPFAVVPAQRMDGIEVSSTHIRKLLEIGEMEQAVRFLGHPHFLDGTVVAGQQLGRTIGVPTANLHLPEGVVVPRFGVYACKAIAEGKEYLAVTNIGTRPTVQGQGITVEAWLLDFEGDLYGESLTLLFYAFLRPEEKFSCLEQLQTRIQKDARQVREFFEKI